MKTTGWTMMLVMCVAGGLEVSEGSAAELTTDYATIVVDGSARVTTFADRASGASFIGAGDAPALAWVRSQGKVTEATGLSETPGGIRLSFGDTGVTAGLRVSTRGGYVAVDVVDVQGDADELCFVNIPLSLTGADAEPLTACALALNLKTDVPDLPGPMRKLEAHAYKKTGFAGAAAAVIACPRGKLRDIMKDAVSAAEGLPHSPMGGPWALEGPINRSSYVFNFDGVSEQTVDTWIANVKSLGFNQIQFHGGSSFRFGDCALSPDRYPEGFASLKRVTDRLHAEGIYAGMQPYAFFIDKRCPWVTPVPDPRLAKDATFRLTGDLAVDATTLPVDESTASMSTITGFFVRNSVILQIDDELVIYTGFARDAPFGFTGCQRGALGTTPAAHANGAKVYHLKELFGLLVPDPETSLFEEVAAKNAELFNEGGFDVIYFDALDGEGVLAGDEWAWHYGSRYVFEVWKRLKRPAVIEMSTFHHHLWYVRSRTGAMDCPTRCYKQFIDMHVSGNHANDRIFLPSNLGWWAFWGWHSQQQEPTFADDIDYLCTKAIGTDSGLSVNVYDPTSPGQQRLAAAVKSYEAVRHAGSVPESVKSQLRAPGREFVLNDPSTEHPLFREVRHLTQKVESLSDGRNAWKVENPFEAQAPSVRILGLHGAAPYESPDGVLILQADPALLTDRGANAGVSLDVAPNEGREPHPEQCLRLTVANSTAPQGASWARAAAHFSPAVNLSKIQGLGVWIYGDGQGEVLNFVLLSPGYMTTGTDEHHVTVDFTGWRYFELIEPTPERHAEHTWPFGDAYSIYRECPNFAAIESLSIYVNNVPQGATATCLIGPIRALPIAPITLSHPRLVLSGTEVEVPVDIPTGSYAEIAPDGQGKLYGPEGALVTEFALGGPLPLLPQGASDVMLSGEAPLRARVTLGFLGPMVE